VVFLHVSVVERSGRGSVPPGATLEVRAGPGPKGQQVTEVISVDASSASQEPLRRPRPERPDYQRADRPTVEELGTVKWYNAIKGFGFIVRDGGGKDLFVHVSARRQSGLADLAEGQRVAIDVADGQKGPEAVSCDRSNRQHFFAEPASAHLRRRNAGPLLQLRKSGLRPRAGGWLGVIASLCCAS
jgi:CspA family cold shock protein